MRLFLQFLLIVSDWVTLVMLAASWIGDAGHDSSTKAIVISASIGDILSRVSGRMYVNLF